MRQTTFIIAAGVLGIAAYLWLSADTPLSEGFGFYGRDALLVKFGVAALSLAVGAFGGSAFRRLLALRDEEHESEVHIGKLLLSTFKQVDFWIGVFVSFFLLGTLTRTMDQISIQTLVSLGIENGFLASTMTDQILRRPGRGKTPKAARAAQG
jgi:hypothetical protein